MNPRLSVVLALCTATTLAGCGGSISKSSSSPTTSPAPVALTVAKAKTLAAAAILTGADLPGYTAEAQTHDASDDANNLKFATCLGAAAPRYLTQNPGTAFTKGDLEIDSSADVATSVADGKSQLAAQTSSKAPACVKSVLTSLMASSGVTITTFSAKPAPVTVPGSDGAFGYVLTFAATAQGQKIEFKGFEAGSLVGQVEVDVTVIASSATTFTLEQTTALLTKATARVKSAA